MTEPKAIADENAALLRDAAGPVRGRTVHALVLRDYDAAFPVLIKNLLPVGSGLKGFVLAAIFGAVVSSLAAMLNSSSTIFAMDIYRKFKRAPSQYELVSVGRICVVVFVFIAMLIAPRLVSRTIAIWLPFLIRRNESISILRITLAIGASTGNSGIRPPTAFRQ